MRKSGCSIGSRVFFVYSKTLGKVETFEGKIVERNFILKKVVFFQIFGLEKEKIDKT